MSIIDRDIEFYSAMLDKHKDAMRRCCPDDEPKHKARIESVSVVLESLHLYRATLA